MLFGRDYATPVSLCLRLALLVLPVLHAAMWSTRFVRDISKLSNPKYRLAIIARGTLAVVSICQVRACDVMTHRTVECHSCRHTHRPSRVAEARGAHVALSVTAGVGGVGLASRCRSSSCCSTTSTASRAIWRASGWLRCLLQSGSRS
jgi:hypothetical protein